MHINAAGPALGGHAHANEHAKRADHEPSHAPRHERAEDTVERSDSHHSDKQPGVIRNLLDGHYKGVADVRLRINFADKLEAIQQNKVDDATAAGLADIGSDAGARLDAIESREDLTDEQREQLASLRSDFESAFGEATAIKDARAAADELLAGLDELTAPPAPPIEEPVEGGGEIETDELETPAPTEIVDTEEAIEAELVESIETTEEVEESDEPEPIETTTLADDVSALRDAIGQAFEDLAESIAGIETLPPLSEPSGHGKAYAKFLEQYLALQPTSEPTPESPDETTAATEPIDVTA